MFGGAIEYSHRRVAKAKYQTVEQYRGDPLVQNDAHVVIETIAFHRAARIPQDTVQRQLIANDPAAAINHLLP